MDAEEEDWLPVPPEEPLPSDCCGSGCTPCVQDIYQEELARWRRLKEMSVEERRIFFEQEKRKVDDRRGEVPSAISPGQYTYFDVESARKAAGSANVYRFKLPPAHNLGLSLGQHIVARVWNNEGQAITRQYTPVSSLDQTDWFEVVIKLYPNGLMSQEIEQWCVGTKVEWKGPFGGIDYQCNQVFPHMTLAVSARSPYVFQGSGPQQHLCLYAFPHFLSVAKSADAGMRNSHVLSNEDEETRLHLVYACRTQHDILMKDMLNEYSSHWNFRVTYHLSQCTEDALKATPGLVKYTDEVVCTRLSEELVTHYLETVFVEECFMVLVCGTRSFDKDMIKYMTKNHIDKSRYHKF